jgi:hypothetical protein
VTTVLNGVASDAAPEAGVGVPLVQEMLTFTLAPLFGAKSLLTMNAAVFRLFTIVQEWVPFTVIATLAQPVWLAV